MTVKQRKFAYRAAQGEKLIDAHAEVYGPGNKKPRTRRIDASRLAAKPDVKAAIAEYEAQLLPIGDLQACKQRMLANIQYLAYHSPDHKVRLAASIDLRNYADERADRERRHSEPVTIETLITELGEMQAPPPVLELETVDADVAASDAQAEANEAQAEATAAGDDAARAPWEEPPTSSMPAG